jgi:ubiquinone/menaquinone biosynthesis C-methylase UbiE
MARDLTERVDHTKVTVNTGDATAMPFSDGIFSVVLSFTTLHHLPSFALQDRVFRETYRVVKPGGMFVGADSVQSLKMHLFHFADTMVCIDPKSLPVRLERRWF